MPGETNTNCRFCGETTTPKKLRRHWRGFCEQLPELTPNIRLCSTCQEPKPITEFSAKGSSIDGLNNACKPCNVARISEWKDLPGNRHRRRSRNFENFQFRPGKWALSPCRYCETKFTKEVMLVHLRECPKNPNARFQPGHHNLPDMEAILERYKSMSPDEAQQSRNLFMLYQITVEDYRAMVTAQGGVCAICGKPPSGKRNSKTINLAVDHCHASGKIRKLLCSHCNAGIGGFKDDTALLRAAIAYLESFDESQSHKNPAA